jgi:DNA replication protein DnaC
MTTTTMTTEPSVRAEADEYGTRYVRDDDCNQHGPFENLAYVLIHPANAGRPAHWIGCPKCAEEREAARKQRDREEQDRKWLAARIARASIPPRFDDATLASYIATNPGQQRALEVAKGYADDFAEAWQSGKGLLLLGNVGTGKTHLAVGIARKAMEQGAETVFTTTAEMLARIKATWGQRVAPSESEVMARFASVDLLVLDEVGSIKCAGREREILFAILGSRHNAMLPTIFTANLTADELPTYLGDQIVSRLRESGSQTVIFGWGDYRPIKGKAMAHDNATTARRFGRPGSNSAAANPNPLPRLTA